MKKSQLKQLIQEIVSEVLHPDLHKDLYYLRLTGQNRWAGGGSGHWFRIRRIEEQGNQFAFFIANEGMEKVIHVTKRELKSGEPILNVAFKIRPANGSWSSAKPVDAAEILRHYFGKEVKL